MQDRNQRIDDAHDVGAGHAGEERQRENVAARIFGLREIAGFPAEFFVDGEQVDGGIMHLVADPGGVNFSSGRMT